MKKMNVFFSMLAAVILLSALPAFSGSGPYGSYGLSGNTDMGQGVEIQHNSVAGATGPYGVFGPTFKGVETPLTPIVAGSGPYGAFDSFGMRGGISSHQIADKNQCLLVATVCPLDLTK